MLEAAEGVWWRWVALLAAPLQATKQAMAAAWAWAWVWAAEDQLPHACGRRRLVHRLRLSLKGMDMALVLAQAMEAEVEAEADMLWALVQAVRVCQWVQARADPDLA